MSETPEQLMEQLVYHAGELRTVAHTFQWCIDHGTEFTPTEKRLFRDWTISAAEYMESTAVAALAGMGEKA